MANTFKIDSIATRPCSAAIIKRQITVGVLMSCGARDFVDLGDGLRFTIGPTQAHRKLTIKLNAEDLYAIERIRRPRGKIEYVSEAFIDDVPAENLAETVLHYGDV